MTTNNSTNSESGGRFISYLSNLPYSAYDLRACSIGTNVYIMGGTNLAGSPHYNYNYLYNALTDSYVSKTNIPSERSQGVLVTDGTNCYYIGGIDVAGSAVKTTYRYNSNNTWTTSLSDCPANRRYAGGVCCNGNIYILGGATTVPIVEQSTLYCYNITGNSWSTLTSAPQTISRPAVFVNQNNTALYSCGGLVSGALSNIVYKYTFATDTWKQMTSMPFVYQSMGYGRIGNNFYIIQGYGSTGNDNKCLIYNINRDYWSSISNSPFFNSFCGSAIVNSLYGNYIYVFAGIVNNTVVCYKV